jgi:hypothetical protein
MPRSRLRQTLLIGFMLLAAPPSMAAMFTLRPGTSLYSRPGFRMTYRLDLRSEEIVVEGPAIEQREQFCLYRLLYRSGRPSVPEQAWVPCYAIDRLFESPR